jgi:hypothetical protein
MIAATKDAIVRYEPNAVPVPDRVRDGGLLTIEGGTHVGFAHIASGPMRLLGNPDAAACRLLAANPDEVREHPWAGLFGTPEQGLLEIAEYPVPCVTGAGPVMRAGRQQMLTTIAVHAFFERTFASDAGTRASHDAFLARVLPSEIPEVRYTPARR